MADGEFTRQTVEVIAKRAGNLCSNPDCNVLTCGPAEAVDRSISIGEAAHIFGRQLGSARFRSEMTPSERSDITNAIWLCRNCHKLIDTDVRKFSTDILFEWRREHEKHIAGQLGQRGEVIRQRVLARELAAFKDASYLAQQIVIDKPAYWEHKLTIELLRTGLTPIQARWRSFERGLYAMPGLVVPFDQMADWNRARMDELVNQVAALKDLATTELAAAWGEPGFPGDEIEILRVCNLLIEACERLLGWEESVRFSVLPSSFAEFQNILGGTAGRFLLVISRIPTEIAKVFEQVDEPVGMHHISLVFDLPDGFSERAINAFEAGIRTAG